MIQGTGGEIKKGQDCGGRGLEWPYHGGWNKYY